MNVTRQLRVNKEVAGRYFLRDKIREEEKKRDKAWGSSCLLSYDAFRLEKYFQQNFFFFLLGLFSHPKKGKRDVLLCFSSLILL